MVEKANNFAIKTEGLTKYYGKVRGIEDLTLEIEEGEVFGFLGPNGAGKTTSIRLFIGLLFPTRGSGKVLGKDIVEDSIEIRKFIGYIAGDVHLYPNMKGGELLDYFAAFKPELKPVLKNELVERFNLDLSKRVREYSRGNRQKLAIVLALMHDSPLLILDEPTLGLDPFMQREFYQVIKEFRERGKTIFLSSHIMSEVEKACQRVGVVQNGRLVAIENVEEIGQKKVRFMEVSFKEDVSPQIFDLSGIKILEHYNRHFRLSVKGDVNQLLKKLSGFIVEDLNFSHASLEEIFFEYYRKEGTDESKSL